MRGKVVPLREAPHFPLTWLGIKKLTGLLAADFETVPFFHISFLRNCGTDVGGFSTSGAVFFCGLFLCLNSHKTQIFQLIMGRRRVADARAFFPFPLLSRNDRFLWLGPEFFPSLTFPVTSPRGTYAEFLWFSATFEHENLPPADRK